MNNEDLYRVVLADDHEVFRNNLKQMIMADCRMDVVGDVCDGLELMKFLEDATFQPHMAIVDVSMPNMGGIVATAKIKTHFPGMKILILSAHKEKEYISKALAAGANGYLLKMDAAKDLFSAIEKIRNGEIYAPMVNAK